MCANIYMGQWLKHGKTSKTNKDYFAAVVIAIVNIWCECAFWHAHNHNVNKLNVSTLCKCIECMRVDMPLTLKCAGSNQVDNLQSYDCLHNIYSDFESFEAYRSQTIW